VVDRRVVRHRDAIEADTLDDEPEGLRVRPTLGVELYFTH